MSNGGDTCFYTIATEGAGECSLGKPGQTVAFNCPQDGICEGYLILGSGWGAECEGMVLYAQSCECELSGG